MTDFALGGATLVDVSGASCQGEQDDKPLGMHAAGSRLTYSSGVEG